MSLMFIEFVCSDKYFSCNSRSFCLYLEPHDLWPHLSSMPLTLFNFFCYNITSCHNCYFICSRKIDFFFNLSTHIKNTLDLYN